MFLPSVLVVLNMGLALVCIQKMCVKESCVEVNHFFTFSFGFIYYWNLPVLIGALGQFYDRDELTYWYVLFRQVPESSLASYAVVAGVAYLCFFLGSLLALKKPQKPPVPELQPDRQLLKLENFLLAGLAGVSIALMIFFAIALQGHFFKGYGEELFEDYKDGVVANAGPRGSFVASTLLMLAVSLTYSVRQHLPTFLKSINNYAFKTYWVASILVVSMGGRLYLVSSILMLFVYKTVYFSRVKLRSLGIAFLCLSVVSGAYGVLRTGGKVEASDALFNLMEEPLYTAMSLLSFITSADFSILNLPLFLIGDFVNLVPSNFIPDKSLLILDPKNYGYDIQAPLGGFNSFVSLEINFGVLGMCIVLMLAGYFLGRLKSLSNSQISKVIYIMVSGCLAFTLFRDKFSISLVKNVIQFSILIPIFINLFLVLMSYPQRRKVSEVR